MKYVEETLDALGDAGDERAIEEALSEFAFVNAEEYKIRDCQAVRDAITSWSETFSFYHFSMGVNISNLEFFLRNLAMVVPEAK